MAGLYIGAMSSNQHQWYGDLLRFGDVRVLEPVQAYSYLKLNSRQIKSVKWLEENHLKYYMEFSNKNPHITIDLLRSGVGYYRLGLVPEQCVFIVSLTVFNLMNLKAAPLETRYVMIGSYGGRTLLNPQRYSHVTGDWVLKYAGVRSNG